MKYAILGMTLLIPMLTFARSRELVEHGSLSYEIRNIDLDNKSQTILWKICSTKLAPQKKYQIKLFERDTDEQGHLLKAVVVLDVIDIQERELNQEGCLLFHINIPLKQSTRIEYIVRESLPGPQKNGAAIINSDITVSLNSLKPIENVPFYGWENND